MITFSKQNNISFSKISMKRDLTVMDECVYQCLLIKVSDQLIYQSMVTSQPVTLLHY